MPDSGCANRGSKTQNWSSGPSALPVASRATTPFGGVRDALHTTSASAPWFTTATTPFGGVRDALDPLMMRDWRNRDTRDEVTRNAEQRAVGQTAKVAENSPRSAWAPRRSAPRYPWARVLQHRGRAGVHDIIVR